MASLPALPAILNLTATTEDDLDDETEAAVYQGQSHTVQIQLLDDNGDPFSVGPTATPRWEIDAHLRSQEYDYDSDADATYAPTVVDGPNGRFELKLTPAQTRVLAVDSGTWDCFLTNLSDPDYDIGFGQIVVRGVWKLVRRTTKAE